MKTQTFLISAFLILVALVGQPGARVFQPAAPLVRAETTPEFGRLPLQFEANQGQADAAFDFLAHGRGYNVFLNGAEAVLVLSAPAPDRPAATLRLQFVGASGAARVAGLDPLPGVVNYYTGRDASQWRTGIPTYARVLVREVYPGIDLMFYGHQGQLEHDFVVAPGRDPQAITLQAQGADTLRIDGAGDLVLATAGGELRLRKPFIYQTVNGVRQEIAGGYALKGDGTFGFELAAYDATRPLIVDPVLDYSTYFGGSADDYGYGIALDTAGNIYVTGATNSTDFPLANPAQSGFGGGGIDCPSDEVPYRVCYDAFVTKLNPTGTALLYSTYIGLPGDDEGRGIAVDTAGNAYMTGQMSVNNDSLPDYYIYKYVLVAKLDPTGAMVYGGWFGASGSVGNAIAVDGAGRAYLTGQTSDGFPTTPGAIQPENGEMIDAFVTVFDPTGNSLEYSTYLGGNAAYCDVCYSAGRGIAVDQAGMIYVTGQAAPSFPVTVNAFQTEFHGFWQAFVAKIDPTRAGAAGLVYATLLGGSQTEVGSGIALDAAGKVYVTGSAKSDDLPTTPGAYDRSCGTDGLCNPTTVCYPTEPPTCETKAQEDVFVAKLDLAQSGAASLLYATYVGGSGRDEGKAIAVDAGGNVYVTGLTVSPDFPVVHPIQAAHGGNMDAFVFRLNAAGSGLDYATLLGGGGDDVGEGIAVSTLSNVYVTGWTGSGAFPVARALQPRAGGWEAFISSIGGSGSGAVLPHHVFLPLVKR